MCIIKSELFLDKNHDISIHMQALKKGINTFFLLLKSKKKKKLNKCCLPLCFVQLMQA